MQAAFVDIGHERAAFLYAGDFLRTKHNVEDVEGEDDEPLEHQEARRRRRSQEDIPPIAELVREGQEILVQVAKGPIGTKGARLTCHVSLPGRFLVFMPTLKHNGVSRKIENFELRKKLKKMIDGHKTKEGGFIVRTAASTAMADRQMKADVDYLLNLWKKIEKKFNSAGAPLLLHYDLDLTTRLIRDHLDDDIDRLVIDSPFEHRKVLRFIRHFQPDLKYKVELHKDTIPLFDKFAIEQEINKALGKRVWLKSGGYLIIETTEALTSIDVNTGRFVGKKTLEETILRTNMEAAEEIVKQLRIRNIGGIIIIDFIDMERDSSKEQVYRYLDSLLREDKSKTTVLKISHLGLVEMTRKRTRDSIMRYMTESCPTCDGKGYVKSKVVLAHQALRDIRRELPFLDEDHLYVTVHPEVLQILKSSEWDAVVQLEKQFQKGVKLQSDPAFHIEQIALSSQKWKQRMQVATPLPSKRIDSTPTVPDDEHDDTEAYERDVSEIEESKLKQEIEAPVMRAQAAVAATQEDDDEDEEDDVSNDSRDDAEAAPPVDQPEKQSS
jgi:ribonuclease G